MFAHSLRSLSYPLSFHLLHSLHWQAPGKHWTMYTLPANPDAADGGFSDVEAIKEFAFAALNGTATRHFQSQAAPPAATSTATTAAAQRTGGVNSRGNAPGSWVHPLQNVVGRTFHREVLQDDRDVKDRTDYVLFVTAKSCNACNLWIPHYDRMAAVVRYSPPPLAEKLKVGVVNAALNELDHPDLKDITPTDLPLALYFRPGSDTVLRMKLEKGKGKQDVMNVVHWLVKEAKNIELVASLKKVTKKYADDCYSELKLRKSAKAMGGTHGFGELPPERGEVEARKAADDAAGGAEGGAEVAAVAAGEKAKDEL